MENLLTLPDHLLDLIVQRLRLPDKLRFSCVCKEWRSMCGPLQFRNHLPWLIVPHQDYVTSKPGTMAFDNKDVGFFSLCDEKIYKAEIPEITNRRICGSFPGGWLMTVHENSEVQLFNPFSRSLVYLPPLTEFPGVQEILLPKNEGEGSQYTGAGLESQYRFSLKSMRDRFIVKVVMSSSSVTSGTIIMAIQGIERTLAFYRIGGDQDIWVPVTTDKKSCFFRDLTYYRGNFYAVHNNGYVVVVHGLETLETIPYTYTEQVTSEPPGKVAERCRNYGGGRLAYLFDVVRLEALALATSCCQGRTYLNWPGCDQNQRGYVDGSSRGNPGWGGACIICRATLVEVIGILCYGGIVTNFEAECNAMFWD
ncbi:hypothetical protein IFM89_010844 [Coptis chinensis]|uniref:F-box domain-containing protein n=1 Tax=Coptis chinensis TaxID=261450 RepID=A0A835I2Z2_9MAGN|nr:hypothetical protein IFM89_010844 [Coptis chinensis]